MARLRLSEPNARFAVLYTTINESLTEEILNRVPVRCEEFTFVDFGSGKGKVVLLASRRPFRKVIGVEFSRELWEISMRNLKSFRGAPQRSGGVEIFNIDAVKFAIPDGPLVLYFYHPFGGPVMQAVFENIVAALRREARPVVVIYVNPECGELFKNSAEFTEIDRGQWHAIYSAHAESIVRQ